MKKIVFSIIVMLFLIFGVKGEAQDSDDKETLSNNLVEFDRAFSFKTIGYYKTFEYVFRDTRYLERSISYRSRIHWEAGARASYRNFSIGYMMGIPGTNRDDLTKIKFYNISANYINRFLWIDFFYERYRGYRLQSGPSVAEAAWNSIGSGSNMKSYAAGINLTLQLENFTTFNRIFSYRAAFEQTEKQLKSGGAALIIFSADYYWVDNSTWIFPPLVHDLLLFTNLYGLTGFRSIGFSFGLGFAYNIVFRNFFIAPMMTLAVNPLQEKFFTLMGTRSGFSFDSFKGHIRISAGYNGERFFAGVFFYIDAMLSPFRRIEIYRLSMREGLYAGFRI